MTIIKLFIKCYIVMRLSKIMANLQFSHNRIVTVLRSKLDMKWSCHQLRMSNTKSLIRTGRQTLLLKTCKKVTKDKFNLHRTKKERRILVKTESLGVLLMLSMEIAKEHHSKIFATLVQTKDLLLVFLTKIILRLQALKRCKPPKTLQLWLRHLVTNHSQDNKKRF